MKKLIVLTLVITAIFSCKKDKPGTTCTADVTSISKSYRITAYTYKQNPSAQETDIYSTLFPDACDRDNTLTFNVNGTYQITDVGLVCSPAGGETGPWSLTGNTIQIDGIAMTIESFDCKKLVMAHADFMVAGDKLKITLIQ